LSFVFWLSFHAKILRVCHQNIGFFISNSNNIINSGFSLQFRIGCSGWSYSSWTGAFYPPNLENSCWLRFYSQIFDYVEIDSTFYRIPNEFMVKNWAKGTPNNFKFTAKFPKVITHDKQLVEVEDDIDLFLKNMEPLHEKTLLYSFSYLHR
jgi:uncharacterized protein YecE (DUF72 family)